MTKLQCSIKYFIAGKLKLIRVSALVGLCYLIKLFNLLKYISLKVPVCVSQFDKFLAPLTYPTSLYCQMRWEAENNDE
jgi:hypothetical protein